MAVAFVIGNGKSRETIKLNRLKSKGTVYGCNALYRDFAPDVLIATDQKISEEIQNSHYSTSNIFYTRYPFSNRNARILPTVSSGWCSGANALYLASREKYNTIFLLGFDLGSVNEKVNNIYAGTSCYSDSDSDSQYGGNWLAQLTGIIRKSKNIEFIRIINKFSKIYPQLSELPNFGEISIIEFKRQLMFLPDKA